MTTGFVWHERYMWHDTGHASGSAVARGMLQPGEHFENPETKRRFKNLMDGYGITDTLTRIPASEAAEEVLLRFHTARYLQHVKALSDASGGDAGDSAPVGPGSYAIAALAAGGVIAAMNAVLESKVNNAYALTRPPGHHAERDRGRGFCIFGNVALAAMEALAKRHAERIAIVDWDVHHGNGTQQAFYERDDTLFISLHQDQLYPPGSGKVTDTGDGAGDGYTINVPLPPGSGGGAYLTAMDRVVVPALRAYRPNVVLVSCGFDASCFDPLASMMLTSNHFAAMMEKILAVADDVCNGRVVAAHEGGYSESYVPFCGVATIDAMRGQKSMLVDRSARDTDEGWHALQPHQAAMIDGAVAGPLQRLLARV
ncbi:MAG: class II histone deacetylase [Gammaproteobacteria bacterium]|nr:class II histone deacetylase [Gammaproteobacteria bacterium]